MQNILLGEKSMLPKVYFTGIYCCQEKLHCPKSILLEYNTDKKKYIVQNIFCWSILRTRILKVPSHLFTLMGLLSYDNESESRYTVVSFIGDNKKRTFFIHKHTEDSLHFLLKFVSNLAVEFVCQFIYPLLDEYELLLWCLKFP